MELLKHLLQFVGNFCSSHFVCVCVCVCLGLVGGGRMVGEGWFAELDESWRQLMSPEEVSRWNLDTWRMFPALMYLSMKKFSVGVT
jgi:hypothetical protein